MTTEALFCTLDSIAIANLIRTAKSSVCYAGPGIQLEPAQAIVDVAGRIGSEMLTVSVDFDERVIRMGFGDIKGIECLRKANIPVQTAQGLRTAFVIVDDTGFIFTPTALYLEAEPQVSTATNALRLSSQQIADALARFSPAAKAIAMARARTAEEKARISAIPVEVSAKPVNETHFVEVENRLKEAPPVRFDLARQVRVYEAYLQYVDITLTGAAIQRHRLAIPKPIQDLGGSSELEGRLRTTFELIEKSGKLSSKSLEDELNEIRKNFTPSLGKTHGRVVLKAAKPHLEAKIDAFKTRLANHQKLVANELQEKLNESRKQIIDYYTPVVMNDVPDAMLGQQLFTGAVTEADAKKWIDAELGKVFPSAESLIQKMQLDIQFKDVTFETLNRDDFLDSLKLAFPRVDWDKAHQEFTAAGETKGAADR